MEGFVLCSSNLASAAANFRKEYSRLWVHLKSVGVDMGHNNERNKPHCVQTSSYVFLVMQCLSVNLLNCKTWEGEIKPANHFKIVDLILDVISVAFRCKEGLHTMTNRLFSRLIDE